MVHVSVGPGAMIQRRTGTSGGGGSGGTLGGGGFHEPAFFVGCAEAFATGTAGGEAAGGVTAGGGNAGGGNAAVPPCGRPGKGTLCAGTPGGGVCASAVVAIIQSASATKALLGLPANITAGFWRGMGLAVNHQSGADNLHS